MCFCVQGCARVCGASRKKRRRKEREENMSDGNLSDGNGLFSARARVCSSACARASEHVILFLHSSDSQFFHGPRVTR